MSSWPEKNHYRARVVYGRHQQQPGTVSATGATPAEAEQRVLERVRPYLQAEYGNAQLAQGATLLDTPGEPTLPPQLAHQAEHPDPPQPSRAKLLPGQVGSTSAHRVRGRYSYPLWVASAYVGQVPPAKPRRVSATGANEELARSALQPKLQRAALQVIEELTATQTPPDA